MITWLFITLAVTASLGLLFYLRVAKSRFSFTRLASQVSPKDLRSIWVFLPAAALMLAVITAFAPSPNDGPVSLPIEVIGEDGYTKRVTFQTSDVGGAASLYLKAYSIGYPQHYIDDRGYTMDKASIRLNGGSWVDINNTTATCEYPESQMGCITGPMHTIRLEIPIENLGAPQEGVNTLDFRFNYTTASRRAPGAPSDPSTGYRILDIELRTGGDTDLIDGTSFVWDDPATWNAPDGYDDAQSVADGEALWTARNTLLEGWNGPNITASCADCHAANGRDLEYFAFSNWSIIARSEYHGLTEEQGKKIAAFIRSVDLKDPDTGETYAPPGRPWHPPYQPGPTAIATRNEDAPRTDGRPFSDISSQLWAAGAGTEWVLDHDKEMVPYLFPGGVSLDDIHPDSSLNKRELPVALQMPDWNEWLPEQHPLDGYTDFETSKPWSTYETGDPWSYPTFYSCLDRGNTVIECGDDARLALTGLNKSVDQYRRGGGTYDTNSPYPEYEVDYSLMRWSAVKQWELIHTHDLADEAREIRCQDNGGCVFPKAAPLQWPVAKRSVFNLASHIIDDRNLKGPQESVHNRFFDTAWYELQVILNSGQGIGTGQGVVDWKYHLPHTNVLDDENYPSSLRSASGLVRLWQNANQDGVNDYAGENWPENWFLRHTSIRWIFQINEEALDTYSPGLRQEVLSELTRAWVLGITPEPLSAWNREADNNQYTLPDESSDPEVATSFGTFNAVDYDSHVMGSVHLLEQEGVDASVLDSLRDWGASLWPNATNPTWEELLDYSELSVGIGAPAAGTTFRAPASFTVAMMASSPNGSIEQIGLRVNNESYSSRSVGPHEFTLTNLPAGTYTIEATATAADGSVGVSAPITVTVESGGEVGSTGSQTIDLQPGWNLISSRFAPDETAIDQLMSDVSGNVQIVEDEVEDDYVYKPEEGVNTLGHWNPLEGFMVYSDTEQQLTINGQVLRPAWTPLALESGWNLVPYLPSTTLPLAEAFQSISEELVLVKDAAGNAYVPAHGVDEIGSLQPGQGYKVFVSGPGTLTYPASKSLNVQQAAQTDPVSSARQE